MVYTFFLVSDEIDDFVRVLHINGDASFLDLHQAILASVNYPDDQLTSFFTCNEHWEKENEITLLDMSSSSENLSLMKDTLLKDCVNQKEQHLLYVFDPLAERVFFLELSKIVEDKELKAPFCSHQEGEAPQQIKGVDELLSAETPSTSLEDDEFYDELAYSDDDLHFDDMSIDDMSNYY